MKSEDKSVQVLFVCLFLFLEHCILKQGVARTPLAATPPLSPPKNHHFYFDLC